MRNPGDILLISCYELGHQPLGLALPLGFLESAGYRPATLDISVERLSPARIAAARLAAISVPMHTALRLGVQVAQALRRDNPSCHICFHGHYARLNADFLLGSCADSALAGECEASLVRLAQSLEQGHDLSQVGGLMLRGGTSTAVLERQSFALPSRSGLRPIGEYASLQLEGESRPAGYVEASRGCLHLCRHCPLPPVYGGRFFVVPQELVLEDIRRQVELGASHITFGDPDFLNGPGHSLALVQAMHRQFPSLSFDFTAKVEHLLRHASRLPELRQNGALFVVSAVESFSDKVLEVLQKGHTRKDVGTALALCRDAGLTLRPTLVPFTPWSSLRDYRDLLTFVQAADLVEAVDAVQFSVRLLVPPGSLLLEHPDLAPHLGGLDPASLSYAWTHPDPRMDNLQRRVSATVEHAAHRQESPEETLQRIWQEYAVTAGNDAFRPGSVKVPVSRRPLPRLSESWFC